MDEEVKATAMERDEIQQMIDDALKVHVYEQHKNRGNVFRPPTMEELQQYAREKRLPLDCVKFYEFYGKKDWMVGKSRMKNWHLAAQSAVRDGWARLPVAQVAAARVCCCGCGQPAQVQRENKWWASSACYYRSQQVPPVKRLAEPKLKLDGRPVLFSVNDPELQGGT